MISKYLKHEYIYAKIIHTDDFYRVPPKQRTKWRQQHSLEHIGIEEYDWQKITQVINDFHSKNISEMPCVDLLTDQVDILRTDFKEIDILILEGLYSLKANVDVKIFIDITYQETKDAQILREKEPHDEFRLKVLEQEHKAIQALKQEASILIDKKFNVISIR